MRLCETCQVIGDEIHHLILCSKFDDQRRDFFTNTNLYDSLSFTTLDKTDKFQFIMQNKDGHIHKQLGLFLHSTFKKL